VHAWNDTSVPVLPGHGPIPQLFDTASGEFAPAPAGGLYVCGITPYDATHLGHAATYVAYDTLIRVWRDSGGEPVYVQNVTDIDDPLLERAAATGVTWEELAESQTDLFRSDMEALSVLPPTHYIGVVESMELISRGVTEMLEADAAYWVGPDLYADLAADSRFGSIGHYDHDTQMRFFAERGGDPQTPGKRNALDPLVWRGEREGEPAWDGGKLGPGRPGWHVECSIIAREYLSIPFVVQGGGEDLIFPHHEMSVSHLRILTDVDEPARVCMHAALLAYDGEKMSKSLGNLVFVSGLREEGTDPDAIRLLLLGQHYRSEWEYTHDGLETATARLETWRGAVRAGVDGEAGVSAEEVLDQVRRHLSNDLDTPAALAAIDDWARSGRRTPADRRLIAELADALLGIKQLAD